MQKARYGVSLSFLSAILITAQAQAQKVDFNREVRPILSEHCFKCHGPDDKQRMAGLRLDNAQGATQLLVSRHRAVVAGKPDQSEVMKRVLKTGAGMMPPQTANKPLTEQKKQILRRWIAQGAGYQPHWAFVAPKIAPVPPLRQAKWVRNPIDAYVLARLEKAGLKPNKEADRYTLIRRVSLDLIGIPPTPEEVDAFVKDTSPNAYEKAVDRLLTSPHFGERWARKWLDLARYADTNGYEKDRPRSVWPYRDWVIHALNQDMPFDQFTIQQLAGDMLPNTGTEQKVATGFHRNTMLNEEGGIDPLEYRFYAMTDRVATTGTTWLGLTVGCAQCHTHKYDPITQKEYYRMMAFIDNADELEMPVPKPDLTQKRQEIEQKVQAREAQLAEKFPSADGLSSPQNLDRKLREWVKQQEAKATRWITLTPTKAKSNLPLLTILPDKSVTSSGDQTKRDVYETTFAPNLKGITAIRLEVLPDPNLPQNGPGRVYYEGPHGDLFLSEINVIVDGKPVKIKNASHTYASGPGAKNSIDGNPQTGWSINGQQGKPNSAVFNLEKPVDAATFTTQMIFELYYPCGIGKYRISATTDTHDVAAGLPPAVEEALLVSEDQRTPEQVALLRKHFLSVAPELKAERDAIQALRNTMPNYPTALVFQERPANNPRPTFVHRRGEFLQATERVTSGTPAFLPPIAKGAKQDRLQFAKWLVSSQNPLTARVTMNRYWANLFGQGIVTTLEDFGYQGQPPTHPELLDYLAVTFMKQGWSVKKMLKHIVTSATYRQSSLVTPLLKSRDPLNRLYARGPKLRLEAELLRDSGLAIAGLLSSKIGGPSVFPPQPANVTSEGTYGPLAWQVSQGEDRYRRGLYTFSKRTAPYAMFLTFDAPSGEACCPRREMSNTPLQALTVLNDQVFVEIAQALGRRMMKEQGSLSERITTLFRRCATRLPDTTETRLMEQFFATQKSRFESKSLDAKAVAGEGEGDPVERACWTALARTLLNLDEVVTKP
jgi:hypothetical protein